MTYIKKPDWLKIRLDVSTNSAKVDNILKKHCLNTVCSEAGCPNRSECFNKCTAAFMILGKNCTRNCRFCKVTKGEPEEVNPLEPKDIAEAVKELKLKHVVITSVTRDDLADGGASHFAKTILEIKKLCKETTIEVLIPDFKGDFDALKQVIYARPNIINHNVETVSELYESVRPMAIFERSIDLLRRVKEVDSSIFTKSGFMVGLGEKEEQVISLLKTLRTVDCDMLTIGQYLQPSKFHHDVVEYVTPNQFKKYEEIATRIGFKCVFSGPLVRSSYYAEDEFNKLKACKCKNA